MSFGERSIHVVGGAGGIGKWFIQKVFSNTFAARIHCYDINALTLNQLPGQVQRHLLQADGLNEFAGGFHDGDWVFLAVPLDAFDKTAAQLAQAVSQKQVLCVSMSSVQGPALDLMNKHGLPAENSIGMHPMFGPSVTSGIGLDVAITNARDVETHRELQRYLTDSGFQVAAMDARKHDNYMALIQGLPHFVLMCFAAAYKDAAGRDLGGLPELRTPVFHFTSAFAHRVLKQSVETTGPIQSTPEAAEMRRLFLDVAKSLDAQLTPGDRSKCEAAISALRAPFTADELVAGDEISAVAVDAVQSFNELLLKYRASERPFVFRHKKTGALHVVRIDEIRHDEVDYSESVIKVVVDGKGRILRQNADGSTPDGEERLAIGFDPTMYFNYREMGVAVPALKSVTIKKGNLKRVTSLELAAFWEKQLLHVTRYVTLANRRGLGERYFEQVLPVEVEGLAKCEFLGAYRKRGGVAKAHLRLTVAPWREVAAVTAEIAKCMGSETASPFI